METRVLKVPGKKLYLAPFGDSQFGAQGCDIKKARRHIQYGIKHNWLFVGTGDYIDFMSPSGRFKMETAGHFDIVHDTLEESALKFTEDAYRDIFQGSEGRWLGMVSGHHFYNLSTGKNTDVILADKLGAPYLGTSGGLAQLVVFIGRCPRPLIIQFTHGEGASQTTAGVLPKQERRLRDWDADLIFKGHDCHKYGIPYDYMKTVWYKSQDAYERNTRFWNKSFTGKRYFEFHQNLVAESKAQTRLIGFTGGWLKTYKEGMTRSGLPASSYGERGGYSPVPTGGLLCTIKPVRESWGWRMDIFVSA